MRQANGTRAITAAGRETDSHQATTGRRAARIDVGTIITERELASISGERVRVPDPDRLVHLQFRRFAGCPICSLHLRSIAARHDELSTAGIREVVLFHSTAQDLRGVQQQLPFAVLADPDKHLYHEFGVESSLRAVLDPRAWLAGLRTLLHERRYLPADHHTGHLGLPADFLIRSDGRVIASKYGTHAYDQWSVDELLALTPTAAH